MKAWELFLVAVVVTVNVAGSASSIDYGTNPDLPRITGNEDYRLPGNVIPTYYNLQLIPYLENNSFTFNGEVEITVRVVEATSTIKFHVDELNIVIINVMSENNEQYFHTSETYDQDLQFCTLSYAAPLAPGSYRIYIRYEGQIRDDQTGFYRSYYNTSSGETRWYASTLLAPVYARRVFPCFDEPALKSTFDISIAHWPNQTVISNSLKESTSPPDSSIGGRVWTKFYRTSSMSTHIVSFTVFDFEHIANEDETLRIWFRQEARQGANYSLGGMALFNELNEYTLINYFTRLSLKMDQVALPMNTPTVMQSWGLITYRENRLLWHDGVSTTRDEQNIVTGNAHEFAHQWFGNLVTPEWWKFVWLSEGLATFFEYYTAARVNPSWRLMEQFTVDVCHPALLADSSDTTRPLNHDVYSPDEIKSTFDIISHQKGGCVMKMLMHVLRESVFQHGLQIYLTMNMLHASNPGRLWSALSSADASSLDSLTSKNLIISTIMGTWTDQRGYPVVTVTRNYTTGTHVISQERFLLKGRKSSNDSTEYRWWIPFNQVTQSTLNFTPRPTDWITAENVSLTMSGIPAGDWVLLNSQQMGFYRVNYDDRNWNLIAQYLQGSNFAKIPPSTRAQLIDDAFNLARAGYLNYTVALSLTRYLRQETDYIPWAAAFNVFSYLNTILANSTGRDNLQTYIFSRVAPIHNSLGYAVQHGEEHVTSFLRADSHSLACRMGCPGCNTQARQLVQNYYNSGGDSPIPVDLRSWAYCEGLRSASHEIWNFMWGRYLLANVAGEQALIISGLGCSLDQNILNRYLRLTIIENSGLRLGDRVAVFNSVYLSSPSNVDVALEFLLNNIDAVSAFYGGFNVVENLLENIAARLVSENQLVSLRTFISVQDDQFVGAAQRAVQIAEENIAWLKIYESDITRWLADELRSAGNSLTTFSSIILLVFYAIISSVH